MASLEDRCVFKEEAQQILQTKPKEVAKQHYLQIGCYYCSGFNKKCDYYVSKRVIKDEIQNR